MEENNFIDMMKKMMELSGSDPEKIEQIIENREKEVKTTIKKHRPMLVERLQMDRERIILEGQREMGFGDPNTKYVESIDLALKLSKLIKIMTEESLRDEGA